MYSLVHSGILYIITYLLACSNPSKMFPSSSCRCTISAELLSIFTAGCLKVIRVPGSSGIWTGDSSELWQGVGPVGGVDDCRSALLAFVKLVGIARRTGRALVTRGPTALSDRRDEKDRA